MVEIMPLPNETVTSLAMALVESSKAPLLLLDDDADANRRCGSAEMAALGGMQTLLAHRARDLMRCHAFNCLAANDFFVFLRPSISCPQWVEG